MKSLLLWLEGPLQSWGENSKFDRRETLNFPTLSGVCGILCAALGVGGKAKNTLSQLVKADFHVLSYPLKSENTSKVMKDFHMIGNGYDKKTDPWYELNIPKKIDGKKPSNSKGLTLTYRYYLQSQAFAVVLTYEDEAFAILLHEALRKPKWALFLGRKSCVPTELIAQGLFATEDEAVDKASTLAQKKERELAFEVIGGRDEKRGDVLVVNDVPLQFGIHKVYRDRYVTVINKTG